MTGHASSILLRQIRHLVQAPEDESITDRHLLQRFLTHADEEAFAHIVRRHGSMVFGVCRSVLGHPQDAEDVFQATFLVLSRRAGSIRKQESLASWLYGVAYRLARKLQAREARRSQSPLSEVLPDPSARPMEDLTWRELRLILHEELNRLPEKNRLPILLCHLEGKTQDEAARQLGWTLGQLRGRLIRGRELLRARLLRRGVMPAVPLLATMLIPGEAPAGIPANLTRPTVRSATLAEEALKAISLARLKVTLAVLLTVAVLFTVVGAFAYSTFATRPTGTPSSVAFPRTPEDRQTPQEATSPRTDRFGDPLPPGALFRLGTLRFRLDTWVSSAVVSPGGKVIATGSARGVHLWDAATGKELRQIGLPRSYATPLAYSPDATILATGSEDNIIRLWDSASGKLLRQFVGHQDPPGKLNLGEFLPGVYQVAFSSDGKTLASLGADRTIRLWEVTTAKQLHQLDAPPIEYIYSRASFAFAPDGKTLVAGGSADRSGVIVVWNTATGKELRRWKSASPIVSLVLSADGKTLATVEQPAGRTAPVTLWDPAMGKELRRLEGSLKGRLVSLAFSSDGKRLASTDDNMLRVWDVGSGKELRSIPVEVTTWGVTFLDEDQVLLSWGASNTIHFWDVHTSKPLRRFAGHEGQLSDVAYSPDGKTVATAGGSDRVVRLWDALSGRERGLLKEGNEESNVTAIAYSPDGELLAAANADGIVRLWQPASGKLVRRLEGHQRWGTVQVAFSPDGKLLASADSGRPRKIRVWKANSGKKVWEWHWASSEPIHQLAFSPNGKTLAVGAGTIQEEEDNLRMDLRTPTLRTWDMATGKEFRLIQPMDRSPVTALDFTRDGRMLVTAHNDRTIRLWELTTGKERLRINHPHPVTAIALSPDGKLLASANGNESAPLGPQDPGNEPKATIRLWDVLTGKEVHRFEGHRTNVSALAFSPDGRQLASSSYDTTALIWDERAVSKARR